MTLEQGEWNDYTLEGVDGRMWIGGVFVPNDFDARTQAAAVFLAPPGGRAALQAVAVGPPGLTPLIDTNENLTELDWDDTTPASATWTLTDPGDSDTPPTYQRTAIIHRPSPAAPLAPQLLDDEDLVGTPSAGFYPAYVADTGLAVGAPATGDPGAVWTAPKIGNVYWPATITAASNTAGPVTLARTATIPAMPFDWRPEAYARGVVTGGASDVRVDLLARINNASTGEICGEGFGLPGIGPATQVMTPGPPAGSNPATYGRIAAGVGGTVVYLRAERIAGSASFSIPADTAKFYVKVVPLN